MYSSAMSTYSRLHREAGKSSPAVCRDPPHRASVTNHAAASIVPRARTASKPSAKTSRALVGNSSSSHRRSVRMDVLSRDYISTSTSPVSRSSYHTLVGTCRQGHDSVEKDLISLGSWCEIDPPRQRVISPEPPVQAKSRMAVSYLPSPPGTPTIPRLPSPDLAPMALDFQFCACCTGDEEDRVNEFWYMASRKKMDSQCEYKPR
jgi:hypothetical protein